MPRSALGLQPLLAFAETAKRGNFAIAARDLGCTPSTLAKAVTRLEKQLGVRLFHRTTRQVTLTDDGERLFARSQRVLAELDELWQEASGARTEPTGTLRINMPVSFGRLVMLPLLAELVRRHPRLSLDVRLSDAYVDVVKEGIDVAIRTGALRDSTLVARTFGSQTLLLCAAPSYLALAGTPEAFEDLREHRAVLFRVPSNGRDRPWQLRVGNRNVEWLPCSRLRIDEGDGLVAAAALGLGISQQPHYMVADRLARGELVEVVPRLRPPPMPVSAVMPSARLIPARVRALLELLDSSREELPLPPPISPERRTRSRGRADRAAVS
jgi:DNA-binding transcriptional LysR family regulator